MKDLLAMSGSSANISKEIPPMEKPLDPPPPPLFPGLRTDRNTHVHDSANAQNACSMKVRILGSFRLFMPSRSLPESSFRERPVLFIS